MNKDISKHVVVIGAGPAGLTAAYFLAKKGVEVTVLESDPTYVGGISKTVHYKGFRFDVGGHRFFSKSKEVEDFWTEILGDDMITRSRKSRIYYRGKFFSYPLKPFEALFKLGLIEACACVLSYAKAKLFPSRDAASVEDWVTNQFGSRLYNIFFKTYTEKVWGMSCKDISADWAAQRIKGLSLVTAVLQTFKPKPKNRGEVIKTLIDSFRYPRLGPGMMWEACTRKVQKMGGSVLMGRKVVSARFENGKWIVRHKNADGGESVTEGTHLISSAPLRELSLGIEPKLSETGAHAAKALHYRDFLTVGLIVKERNRFDDNWIYIHDPTVKVGRIQNFKSWSPEMVPDHDLCCYGLEYFCFEGDGLWNSKDEDLITLAKTELEKLGLGSQSDFVDGVVIRQPKAYPVYDSEYKSNVARLNQELESRFPTLHLVGRNGMHKYNNQDHAIMTAMLCAENILADHRVYDLWRVNEDAEYIESGTAGSAQGASGLRAVPAPLKKAS